MSGASRRASLALVVGVVAACSRAPLAPPRSSRIAAPPDAPRSAPPRYVVPNALSWVERLDDLDRVVVGGRRVELRGHEVIVSASPDPEVDGGARQPSWARGASDPAAYVFWRGRDVFAAPSFTAPLTKIATLPRDVTRAASWLDGVVLLGASGALVVRPSGASPSRIEAGSVDALAVDARRAIVLSSFDRAWLTLDGGKSRRDVTAEVADAIGLATFGEHIVVRRRGGGDRMIDATGRVSDAGAFSAAQAREPEDHWPADHRETALEAAVTRGLVLDGNTALAVSGGTYGRIDLATGRATSIASIDDDGAECTPFRASDEPLLLCVTEERAFVVHTSDARREKTFDLAGAPDVDRFVGSDGESLGYVGPCEDTASPLPEIDAVSGASPVIASSQRSATFCVRAGPERWIEHRLDRADARDVIAWIPRASGDAIALVARDAAMIADADRVSVRGPLRILRVARTEPPLSLPMYADRATEILSRQFRAESDGSIEGWLPSSSTPSSAIAISIDRDGHPRVFSAPAGIDGMATAGRFGLATSDDGRVFETIDQGRSWLAVAPSPEIAAVTPSSCTEVGCRIGSLLRIGWSDHTERAADIDERGLEEAVRERRSRPARPLAPIALLACEGVAAPIGARLAGSFAFGLTKSTVPRTSRAVRLASLGTMLVPYSAPGLPPSGDAEIAWIAPLDLGGVVERRTIPLTNTALGGQGRFGEVHVGFMLSADGVATVALGANDACAASLLDSVGVTRSLGGCLQDPSVGVELRDRAIFAGYRGDALVLSSVAVRGEAGRKSDRIAVAGGAREIMRVPLPPGARARSLAIGARHGDPVLVAIEGGGEAILAPIDADHGALGVEEPLAPLGGLGISSSPACTGPSRADEARVLFPLEGQIGLVPGALRGVTSTATGGFAVIRWSRDRACLEAIEIGVRDERFEGDIGSFDPPTTLRNLVARFSANGHGALGAALVEIGSGFEIRQRLSCSVKPR